MLYKPPNKILIKSDDNILEYQKTLPKNKNNPEEKYVYKFIESKTKKDVELEMTADYIEKQLTNYFRSL